MILTIQHLVSHLSPSLPLSLYLSFPLSLSFSLFASDEPHFTVRINGNDREGIVEVSYSGRWGSV